MLDIDPANAPTFAYTPVIPREEGVTRRDPSPVVRIGDAFHVRYSKATVDHSGYYASVWHASSPDGFTWTEHAEAVPKGPDDAWDANGVFTPTTLVVGERIYLFYTAVPKPFTNDNGGPNCTPTAIGIAYADDPHGPWTKFDGNPVLRPSDDPADFDSLRVDDACFIVRGGKYWLYYKGRQAGNTPSNTKIGIAFADHPTGPYTKYEGNPVLDSGHEVCVWPTQGGVASILAPVGPHGSTLQFAADGKAFDILAEIEPPKAPGPFRADHYANNADMKLTWGVSMEAGGWPYLVRFDCDI